MTTTRTEVDLRIPTQRAMSGHVGRHVARSTTRFPALDGLRLLGSMAVLTTHVGFASGQVLGGPYAGPLSRLDVGVPIFFAVSGFLLWLPRVRAHLSEQPQPSVGRYLQRRALRILPALWVTVVACALLIPSDSPNPGPYLRLALLTQVYVDFRVPPGLNQMWSLATETAFYVVLPVLGWAWTRRPALDPGAWARRTLRIQGALLGVDMAWIVVAHATGHGLWMVWLPAVVGWFGVGMAAATWHAARTQGWWVRSRLDGLAEAPGTCWALAAGCWLILTTQVAGPFDLNPATLGEALVKNLGYALVAGLILLPTVAPTPPDHGGLRLFSGWGARFGGEISYGIFCYHMLILTALSQALGYAEFPFAGHFWQLWCGTVVLSVPLAALSHRYLERPFMDGLWSRRGVRRVLARRRIRRTRTEQAAIRHRIEARRLADAQLDPQPETANQRNALGFMSR